MTPSPPSPPQPGTSPAQPGATPSPAQPGTSPAQTTPSPAQPGTSPNGKAAASGPGSSTAASGRFVVEAGPAFDADGRPQGEPLPPQPDDVVLELWEEKRVRQLLTAKGTVVHAMFAVDRASGEWLYTKSDLEAIAPPLTAILNRYDATRAAAHAGDELALVVGLAGYTARSWRERMAALRAADQGPQPITGRAPDPVPEDDEPDIDPGYADTTTPLQPRRR